ncbi:S41 family peptidase [Pedobacter sp. PWIIR3]
MKNMHFKNWVLFTAMSLTLTLSACRKSKTPAPTTPTTESNTKQTPTTNRMELSNDSLFLYAKEIYFWNESLPSYDTYVPRQYNTSGSTLLNLESNLYNLVKAAAKPDYLSTSTEPKYSFIDDISTANPTPTASIRNEQASVDLEGNGNDVGIYAISAVGVSSTVYKLYIQAVFENSPAFKAGLTRGAYITEINGTPVGTVTDGNIAPSERTLINSTIYGNPAVISLKGFKTDGTAFNVSLTKASYKSSPIYKSNVITAGTHKIGYLAYARFSNEGNSVAALTAVINDFAAKNVTDLVVDLRYNGGGYVSTAEQLTNLLAPSSATGVMYIEHFNNNLKNRKTTDPSILKNQPYLDANDKQVYQSGRALTYADLDYSVAGNTNSFAKTGDLKTVTNIVFIVSGRTASASELVINNLKPKMKVSLVGKTTYGKPIGFFPFRLENRYDVYLSLFETRNSADQGGYYTGMVPDVDGGVDYGDYDWGNPSDGYLAKAIDVISPGIKGVISANRISGATGIKSNVALSLAGDFQNDKEFVGMIDDKPKIKK